ncbi:helix-turn-helix domain-containing protein [Holdemania massiliensis]|uniref:helix-turn-helix domain-containing protein n=1 Tax=Holdemania massiliensis TaxID=1468449 RepID=UPI001F056914|nr:helix-turn-helix transcriptional regulator [Holdemania massiliensis]MCH1939637.1 helix-turn-helix domain-containing protein [Holdemania massiliensis]
MHDFYLKLKILRKEKKITQQQLADRLGITKAMVSAYENGIRLPSYDILIKIAAIFNVSTDFLLGVTTVRNLCVEGLTEHQIELLSALIEELQCFNQKAIQRID